MCYHRHDEIVKGNQHVITSYSIHYTKLYEGEPRFISSDIDNLTNTDLSFIFSLNCLTGQFDYTTECFAEKFHRYTYNGENAGALGLIAATQSYNFV